MKSISILLAFVPSLAFGQMTGPQLASNAQAKSPMFMGYVLAMTDVMMALGNLCPTAGVTGDQIVDRVSTFVIGRPDLKERPGVQLVAMALVQSYPCNAEFVPQAIPSPKSMLPGNTAGTGGVRQ